MLNIKINRKEVFMKNVIKLLIALIAIIGFIFTACDENNGETHTHSYSDTWSKNAAQHWKECSCGDKTQIANHSGNPCGVCSYDSSHSHSYSDTWSKDAAQHWKECSCGDKTQIANHSGNPCGVCGYNSESGNPNANWMAVENSTFDDYSIVSIAYGNNIFVAVSQTAMAYSTNGITWLPVSFNSINLFSISDIIWDGNRFVVITANRNIFFSSDGINWSEGSMGTASFYPESITYGNNKYIIGGGSGTYKIAYSTDGASWDFVTDNAINSVNQYYDVIWGKDKFIAVGSSGQAVHSSDGINWTPVADTKFGNYYISGITWGGTTGQEKFVAVGNQGRITYSSDGVNWMTVTDSKFGITVISSVTWGNGKFVAVGRNGKIAYSNDGENWIAVTNSTFTGYINAITWGNNKFVAVGNQGRIAYWDGN